MTLAESIEQIESGRFESQVGVASGVPTLRTILEAHPAVRALADAGLGGAALALNRLTELSNQQFDRRYAHPHDIACAAYLVVVAMGGHLPVGIAVDLAGELLNGFWAPRLAAAVDDAQTERSDVVVINARSAFAHGAARFEAVDASAATPGSSTDLHEWKQAS